MSDDFANPTERIARALWDRKPSPVSDEEYEHNLYGNRVGVFGKMLGGLGLDASGERKAQPWGKAIMSTLDAPAGLASSIGQAVTAPARAYRGEIPEGQMIPEGLNFAGSVALGSAAVPRPANAAGMFGGRLAKTADHDALARAEELAAKGTPRETIWNDTGWFQGPDKKWRFEIDDSGQRLKRPLEDLDKAGLPMPSDLVFQHDKLHEAYPQVGDIPWYRTPEMEAGGGSYDPVRGIRIGSGHGFASGKSGPGGMTLHEQQHALQDIEGFARGGSREYGHPIADVKREAQAAYEANRAHQQSGVRTADDELLAELGLEQPKLTQEWSALTPRQQLDWYDAGRGRLYNNLAGEVEARTVQKRMDMTPEERRARPPWLDYDVPEADQIVRFGGSGPQMSVPEVPGTVLSSASHLDMSPEARMARAREMGFNTSDTYYHGTHSDFDQFDTSGIGVLGRGTYFTRNAPGTASVWARGEDGSVIPAYIRGNYPDISEAGALYRYMPGFIQKRMAESRGHDGYTTGGGAIVAVHDPSNIRSVNAAFDPAKSSSANLLVANPETSAAPGLGLMAAAKEAERPGVFDDKLIEILRKYGLLGTLGAGAAVSQSDYADAKGLTAPPN